MTHSGPSGRPVLSVRDNQCYDSRELTPSRALRETEPSRRGRENVLEARELSRWKIAAKPSDLRECEGSNKTGRFSKSRRSDVERCVLQAAFGEPFSGVSVCGDRRWRSRGIYRNTGRRGDFRALRRRHQTSKVRLQQDDCGVRTRVGGNSKAISRCLRHRLTLDRHGSSSQLSVPSGSALGNDRCWHVCHSQAICACCIGSLVSPPPSGCGFRPAARRSA